MQSRNLKTLDEAVNNIPGVFSTRSKGMMDTSAAISLRGMPNSASASRTLVMIDGMPINTLIAHTENGAHYHNQQNGRQYTRSNP